MGTVARIQTRQAARATTQQTIKSNAAPQTIARLRLKNDEDRDDHGAAVAATIYFRVDSTPATAFASVQWIVTWGYGGASFQRTIYSQGGRITVVGDSFSLSAQLNDKTAAGNSAVVSGAIIPQEDGQTRWATSWNPQNQTVAARDAGNWGSSSTGADGYAINLPPAGITGPCTLWRASGYRYDAGAAIRYLMAFDTVAGFPPTDESQPALLLGAVASNGTFSIDLSETGRDFSKGLVIAASTDGNDYARDATVLLALDVEILNN